MNFNLFSSFKRYIFVYQFIIVVSITVLISVSWFFSEYHNFKINKKKQHDWMIAANKKLLKTEARKIISIIEFNRKYFQTDSLAKEAILDFLANYRVEYGGYIFVNHIKGEALIYDGVRQNNRSVLNMKDSRGYDLFKMETNYYSDPNGGFMEYYFKKMNDSIEYKKISYVIGYHDFGWIIGAGNYIDELENENSGLISFFHKKFIMKVWLILIVLFFCFVLIYLISKILSDAINQNLQSINQYVDKRIAGEKSGSDFIMNLKLREIKDFMVKFDDLVDNKQALELKQKNYANQLELIVNERTDEIKFQSEELKRKNADLERINDVFVDREFRIKELKQKIEMLVSGKNNLTFE